MSKKTKTIKISNALEQDWRYVDIEIIYRKRPKTSELLIEGTKWVKSNEDGLTLFCMGDNSGNAIPWYMKCATGAIPINNYIYYVNSKCEYTIYAYISYFKEGSNIYEISNDVYDSKLKIRRNFAFHIGEKQALDIFYGANRINYRKLLFTDESMYSVSKISGATKLYEIYSTLFAINR